MSREANQDKKLQVTLIVSGKKQLIEIIGFCGEVDTLQEVIDFLEELGTSEDEIKRLLQIGTIKADLGPFKTRQQALNQLGWLIIIQGQIGDVKKRVDFLKEKCVEHEFLKEVITLALKLSSKLYKTPMDDKQIARYIDLIIDGISEMDQSKRLKLSGNN